MKKALTLGSIFAAMTSVGFAQAVTINIGATANQGQVNGTGLSNLLDLVQSLTARAVPLFITIAVLAFFWFLISFIIKGNNPGEQDKAKTGMGYSILALFVMVSIWGLVGFLGSVTGIGQGGRAPAPCVPGVRYPAGDPCA